MLKNGHCRDYHSLQSCEPGVARHASSQEKYSSTYRSSTCSRDCPTDTMGIPVEASSAPEMRLVNRLGIVGRTGHSYEVGWMGDDHPGQDRRDIREGLDGKLVAGARWAQPILGGRSCT